MLNYPLLISSSGHEHPYFFLDNFLALIYKHIVVEI